VDVVVETAGLLGAAPERSAAYGRAEKESSTLFGAWAWAQQLLAPSSRQRVYAGEWPAND